MNKFLYSRFLIVTAAALFFSCSKQPVEFKDASREVLFSLAYGSFEDEIDLFNLDDVSAEYPARLYMCDGIFYVVNGAAKKVMQFTSYGDLMGLYFNETTNPMPSFVDNQNEISESIAETENAGVQESHSEVSRITTRQAVSFPFNYPEYIAVNSKKTMYVSDRLPEERLSLDVEFKVLLQDVVMCFQSNGTYIGYLGQEGMGGAAFPSITGVYTNSSDDIIVVSRIMNGHVVFWYNSDGTVKYRIPIIEKNIPVLETPSGKAYAQLEKVLPAWDNDKLYLKVDYFSDAFDIDTNAIAGLHFVSSSVLVFDLNSRAFAASVDVPVYKDEKDVSAENYRLYEFMGVTSKNELYFMTPLENSYALQIINVNNLHVYKHLLQINRDESEYHAFMLSPTGILSAILASPEKAKIVWWKKGLVHD